MNNEKITLQIIQEVEQKNRLAKELFIHRFFDPTLDAPTRTRLAFNEAEAFREYINIIKTKLLHDFDMPETNPNFKAIKKRILDL